MGRSRVKVGELRHALELQELTVTTDIGGQSTRSWVTVDTVWGSVEPLFGDEYFEAQKLKAGTGIKVKIRDYQGLRPQKHRLTHEGRVLNITRVLDMEERHCLSICWCREEP